jgi:hypothetical protein
VAYCPSFKKEFGLTRQLKLWIRIVRPEGNKRLLSSKNNLLINWISEYYCGI